MPKRVAGCGEKIKQNVFLSFSRKFSKGDANSRAILNFSSMLYFLILEWCIGKTRNCIMDLLPVVLFIITYNHYCIHLFIRNNTHQPQHHLAIRFRNINQKGFTSNETGKMYKMQIKQHRKRSTP